jgi:hypothetical protein
MSVSDGFMRCSNDKEVGVAWFDVRKRRLGGWSGGDKETAGLVNI